MNLSRTCLISLPAFLLLIATAAIAQQEPRDSNVPESVRQMIEQSQGGRYEQMARMQVGLQYGDFLDSLSGGTGKRQRVEDRIVEVISERAQLSERAVTGQASPAELESIGSYAYLRSQLAPLLSSSELQTLDAQQGALAEQQLRRNYSEQLAQVAPALSEADRDLVLDTLVRHMLFNDSNADQRGRLSAEQLVNQQLLSLRDAREELQSTLAGPQLEQVNLFLNRLRSNLFLNQSMSDTPQ